MIRDEFYCGRRFHAAAHHAVWFIEEDELKIYRNTGELECVLTGPEISDNAAEADNPPHQGSDEIGRPTVLKMPPPVEANREANDDSDNEIRRCRLKTAVTISAARNQRATTGICGSPGVSSTMTLSPSRYLSGFPTASLPPMSRLLDYIVDAVRSPREQLSRGQHFVRHSWELTAHCWRQLQRHRAEGMAAELTYRTIFSLIPVVVLGLVMFRVVGGLEDVQSKVENQLYSFFGVPEIPAAYLEPRPDDNGRRETRPPHSDGSTSEAQTVAASETAGNDASGDGGDPTVVDLDAAISVSEQVKADAIEETRREARASIRRTLHDVISKVSSVDFKSIGVFGCCCLFMRPSRWPIPPNTCSIASMMHRRNGRSTSAWPSIGRSSPWAADCWR